VEKYVENGLVEGRAPAEWSILRAFRRAKVLFGLGGQASGSHAKAQNAQLWSLAGRKSDEAGENRRN
jgi:hypothetical protein